MVWDRTMFVAKLVKHFSIQSLFLLQTHIGIELHTTLKAALKMSALCHILSILRS